MFEYNFVFYHWKFIWINNLIIEYQFDFNKTLLKEHYDNICWSKKYDDYIIIQYNFFSCIEL